MDRTTDQRRGAVLILLSAASFGSMAILGKLAYRGGVGVPGLLAVRFTIAAAAFWLLARRGGVRVERRIALGGLALGALYGGEASLWFLSLTRIDASLASMVFYVYPAIVVLVAMLSGRERPTGARMAALTVASAGTALVLLGGGRHAVDSAGILLAVGAALAYSVYILAADRIGSRLAPAQLGALLSTGAAASLWPWALAAGDPLHGSAGAWAAVAGVALFSTVVGIGAFVAGLRRLGPSTASILSTVEPVFTVALAVVVLGDAPGAVQIAGGALVLAAVLLLRAERVRIRRPRRRAGGSHARTHAHTRPLARLVRREAPVH